MAFNRHIEDIFPHILRYYHILQQLKNVGELKLDCLILGSSNHYVGLILELMCMGICQRLKS